MPLRRRRRTNKQLSACLKAHVDAARLSIEDVAKRTGWDYLRALRILNGKTRPLAVDVETLATVLGKPVGDLYCEPAEARAS